MTERAALLLLPFFLLVPLLNACGSSGFLASTEQTCNKYPPSDERTACEKKNKEILSAAEKQRAQERAEAQKSVEKADPASGKKNDLCFTRQSTGERVCPN